MVLIFSVCELSKSHHTSFLSYLNKSSDMFRTIYSDVCGAFKVSTLGGSQ